MVVPVYYVYILRCSDGTLYTGSTNDLAAREVAHNSGRGAKYTAGRRPVRMVYTEEHESRSTAQSREYQLKRLTREDKETLVAASAATPHALAERPRPRRPCPPSRGALRRGLAKARM